MRPQVRATGFGLPDLATPATWPQRVLFGLTIAAFVGGICFAVGLMIVAAAGG